MPLLDDPTIERVVFRMNGQWVDGNGRVVDDKEAKKHRRLMKAAAERVVVHLEARDDSDLDEDDDEEEVDYSEMTVAELKAEIAARNEAGANISSDGNKADLVAALEADDESEE